MARVRGQVTERTFYPPLMRIIEEEGGLGVSEITFNSVPDIVFDLLGRQWLLSVKIGESSRVLREAFIQYQRHKDESRLNHGITLFLPESVRSTHPTPEDVLRVIRTSPVTCIIDTPDVKDERRDMPFRSVLRDLTTETARLLRQGQKKAYPIGLVVNLLQQHVQHLMDEITLSEDSMLEIFANRDLLSNIGHVDPRQSEDVARFLAAYIVLSQILFLRLLHSSNQDFLPLRILPTHSGLRDAFARILEINYRPIFSIDVLNVVSEEYLRETYDLIWGLEVERVRHDLAGRIFHELMPPRIRKMVAAFYTRPYAADLLAALCIDNSTDSVIDLACGSGTLLTAAYRQKRRLFDAEGRAGNPHKRFCENDIFGADVMPFVVHLTSTNLSAIEPSETLERTQIVQGDSLKLVIGNRYDQGLGQMNLFIPIQPTSQGTLTTGEAYEVGLQTTNVVLMNPPFTKVERRIQDFVNMGRYKTAVGGEVGIWGHFIPLAYEFLTENGVCGAVLPISILRGREGEHVRKMLFDEKWTPLYVLKPTINYGFSEWSEYRDVLLVARKGSPAPDADHRVRFALITKDLTKLNEQDAQRIAQTVRAESDYRDPEVQIQSFPLSEVKSRITNMMWFCGVSDFRHRDVMTRFVERFDGVLKRLPIRYFREGFRPVPKGVSSFLFLTRNICSARTEEAFLRFDTDDPQIIRAQTSSGTPFNIERRSLTPTLRTIVGLESFDISDRYDFIAHEPYNEHSRVLRASGFESRSDFRWSDYWDRVRKELRHVTTNLVVARRINPFSPNQCLVSFFSNVPICPSNQVNVVVERNEIVARATCVVLNSAVFIANFFLLKEESTGRNIDIRFYDLDAMKLYPSDEHIQKLASVFEQFAQSSFPSLREQFDRDFDSNYRRFWEQQRSGQPPLFDSDINPSLVRISFDRAVCEALGVPMTDQELIELYRVIAKEMIVIKGLQRD